MANKSIRRVFAALALFMALLVSTACLGGDKIAGKWIGRTESHGDLSGGSKVDNIIVWEIKKNGDSYVMDYKYLILRKDGWQDWGAQKGLGATLNGNLISVLFPGATLNMTYIEKDKTIQTPPMGISYGTVTLERDDDGKKLEALKNELLQEYQEKQNSKAK